MYACTVTVRVAAVVMRIRQPANQGIEKPRKNNGAIEMFTKILIASRGGVACRMIATYAVSRPGAKPCTAARTNLPGAR